jgi:hypothetical protein
LQAERSTFATRCSVACRPLICRSLRNECLSAVPSASAAIAFIRSTPNRFDLVSAALARSSLMTLTLDSSLTPRPLVFPKRGPLPASLIHPKRRMRRKPQDHSLEFSLIPSSAFHSFPFSLSFTFAQCSRASPPPSSLSLPLGLLVQPARHAGLSTPVLLQALQ